MSDSRNEENHKVRDGLVVFVPHQRVVDMPHEPLVHWLVPESPVLPQVLRVPPGLFTHFKMAHERENVEKLQGRTLGLRISGFQPEC